VSAPPAQTPRRPDLVADAALLLVSLAAGLGAARLTRTPGAAAVVGPIVATVATGHVAASTARRLRLGVAGVGLTGLVAVALAVIWGTVPATTWSGLPTAATLHALQARFSAAGSVIRSNPTPLPATTGVVLCLAAGAGMVAVFGRCLWAWRESATPRPRPLLALLPSFGLFCYTALLSSDVDRLTAAMWYLGAALVFVIAADRVRAASSVRVGREAPAAGGGRRRSCRGAWRDLLPTFACAALAVVLPLAASPALGALRLDALPFPAKPGQGGLGFGPGTGGKGASGLGVFGSGSADTGVRTIDLVDDLQGVLSSRTTEVMFSAQTPHPTYWQLAVLTQFDGTQWLPDQYTQAAALNDAVPERRSVPDVPVLPEPASSAHYTATITIAGLQSTLLPVPPTTETVDGAAGATVVGGVGVVRQFEAEPELTYSAVARVPGNPSSSTAKSGGASRGSSAGVAASLLAPYQQLPPEPSDIVQLAHNIVAGASGPAAEAAALARWFDTGRFHYSLSPPPLDGPDPLASFLFTTRTGFCQQFAAAYAVLARIDDLPTRVAVGFTTGTSSGHNRYRVTGADAHVWPEVYLGPQVGWASYEPTPAVTGELNGVGVSTGSRATSPKAGTTGGRSTPTTAPDLRRTPGATTLPSSTTPKATTHGTHGVTPGAGSSASVSWVVTAVVLAVLALAATAWTVRRRRRARAGAHTAWRSPWRRPRWWGVLSTPVAALGRRSRRRRLRARGDPTGAVLTHWNGADRVLARARLGKQPAETIDEHVARLRSLAGSQWLAPHSPATGAAKGAVAADPGAHPPAADDDGDDGAQRRTSARPQTVTGVEAAVTAYAGLAELAIRASYGAHGCTDDDAEAAARLERAVRDGIGAGQRRIPVGV
jgi:transglutaminase-like putative cysteine protease